MSKIGRKPIEIPEGVTISKNGGLLMVKGKLGELQVPILSEVNVEIADDQVTFSVNSTKKQILANWGTSASLLRGAIEGVINGYKKELEIIGVGFKAMMQGKTLVLSLGFSHPIEYVIPEGIEVEVDKNTKLSVSGIDKAMVGQVAAEIRKYKRPEPYQGKGIRYVGEKVRRKQGKKVAGSTG